jgi:DMSO/TMAO reductase YedYZ molybdopterin-dependent catalytic subunit
MAKTRESETGNHPATGGMTRQKSLRIFVTHAWAALVAGLVASLIAVVVMGILRIICGVPTPVELFSEFYLKHINVATFIQLLGTFKDNPKTAPLGLALLSMIGAGTVLGLLYVLFVRVNLPVSGIRPGRREWLVALVFAAAMTLIGVVLFWNELRANFFGLPFATAIATTILGLLADFVSYGVVLAFAYRILLPVEYPQPSSDFTPGSVSDDVSVRPRRRFLARAGVLGLGLAAGASMYGLLQEYLRNYASYDGFGPGAKDKTPLITSTSDHYVVTKNAVDPTPSVDLWQFEVTGLVKNAGSYTYTELQKLPSVERAITLECIANNLGRTRLISTAIWKGVSLQTLLTQHGGALPEAKYIAFYCADGYNVSLPLQEVLAADTLFAWHMNGEPLPNRHGFPLRVLIPGRYGEENPKWLTRIALIEQFESGLYSSQGWYNGMLHTTSRIDYPRAQSPLVTGQQIEVGGIAFAGNRGIRGVEVSVDGGESWREASLQPPPSKDTWVPWSLSWVPAQAGMITLVVRATDGTGEQQSSHEQGPVPNGATGYHKVSVQVMAK